jgi:hypothetical protein
MTMLYFQSFLANTPIFYIDLLGQCHRSNESARFQRDFLHSRNRRHGGGGGGVFYENVDDHAAKKSYGQRATYNYPDYYIVVFLKSVTNS